MQKCQITYKFHGNQIQVSAYTHIVGAVWKTVVLYEEWYLQVCMTVPDLAIPIDVSDCSPPSFANASFAPGHIIKVQLPPRV